MSTINLVPAPEGTPDSSNTVNVPTSVDNILVDLSITEQPIPVDSNNPYTALPTDLTGLEDKSLLIYDAATTKWVPTRTLDQHYINGGQY